MIRGLIVELGDTSAKSLRHYCANVGLWHGGHRKQFPMVNQLLNPLVERFHRISNQHAQINRELQLIKSPRCETILVKSVFDYADLIFKREARECSKEVLHRPRSVS